jgi:hypothetical protein
MASWSREGAVVEVLTVLACDPASEAPAGGWDRRGGFETEGASARDRHGDEADVQDAVSRALAGADTVVVPGLPLTHPDHAWLARILDVGGLEHPRVGVYAEQPYTLRVGADPAESGFARTSLGLRDRLAKWRAIRCYASQLPVLGMRPHRYAAASEWIGWRRDYPPRAR